MSRLRADGAVDKLGACARQGAPIAAAAIAAPRPTVVPAIQGAPTMSVRLFRPDGAPCLFVEGLVPNTWIPAYFGKHMHLICTGAGNVPLQHRIAVSAGAIGKTDRLRQLVILLDLCGYTRVGVYPAFEMPLNGEFGVKGVWTPVGKRMEGW